MGGSLTAALVGAVAIRHTLEKTKWTTAAPHVDKGGGFDLLALFFCLCKCHGTDNSLCEVRMSQRPARFRILLYALFLADSLPTKMNLLKLARESTEWKM